ncbi:hypothetical protein RUM44_013557 [Polyplax serrata]|uniref:Phospholipid/glycerol acyltransferase domain-containing protein n=1 Tax=Polyplax serrata TaxID=468196 RepID=A0ABR1BGE4_POLSC
MDIRKVLNGTKVTYLAYAIVFLVSGLLINCVQFALYYTLNVVNKRLFRKVNYYLNYSLFSQTVFVLQYWAGVKVMLHAKKSDYENYFGKESVLLIMNHTYEIDWLIGWVLCDNCNVLGNCKTFAKKSIQYVPTLGVAWKLGGSIFLERVWNKDKKIFESKLKELTSYEDVFWLLLAAEGTRFTEEKHEASKAFAKEHGLPELQHHLTPRTKGFTTALPYIRDKIPAIYSIHVGVRQSEVKPSFLNVLLGKKITSGLYVERIPMTDVPEGEEAQATWLHNLYKRKDDALHSYLETGDWFKISNAEKCEGFYLPRRLFPLLNFLFWAAAILGPFCYFLVNVLISGNILYIGTTVAVLVAIGMFFDKIVGQTKISKSSSYGVRNSSSGSKNK